MILKVLIWFFKSLDNTKEGASGRKIGFVFSFLVASILSYLHTTSDILWIIVGEFLIFGLILIGLITIPELLKALAIIKNGNKEGQETNV